MTTTDYSKLMKDMMGAFPVDAAALQDSFRTQAALAERISRIMLEAAEKSTEISTSWTRNTLARVGEVSALKAQPADYPRAVSEFASVSAEVAAEKLAAFAEIAKKVQLDAVELLLAAGKDISEDMTAAATKATQDLTAVARKSAAAPAGASK